MRKLAISILTVICLLTFTLPFAVHANGPIPPFIQSCDEYGSAKNVFNLSEKVYAHGDMFPILRTYDLYVVNNVTWTNGMTIPARVSGTATSISSSDMGDIPITVVWSNPMAIGSYDIVVDVNGNGKYDQGIDVMGENDVVKADFVIIPELSSFVIMLLFMIVSALSATILRKTKHSIR